MESQRNRVAFTFIDLHAGIGGNRLAFERAGGKCVLAWEPSEAAHHVYSANYGVAPVAGITNMDGKDIPEHDVLSAYLPLTAHSSLMGSHSPADWSLLEEVVKVLKAKRPKAFLLQCSPSQVKSRAYQDKIAEMNIELGYNTHRQVIDAGFLVPQKLKLLYTVGFREKTQFTFPELEGAPRLGDILESDADPKYTLPDKKWARIKEQIHGQETQIRRSPQRYEVADLGKALHRPLSVRTVREVFIPQSGDRNPRRLTPRECARLMGYPDSFKLPAHGSSVYALLSHSPVVPVVEKIANAIKDHLVEQPGVENPSIRGGEQDMPWRAFQGRVASWLQRVHGFEVETPSMVSGGVTLRPYDVDVHAWKNAGLVKGRVDVWVECKKLKTSVRRSDVSLLIQKAREVRDGGRWSPNVLMFVAEGGFDSDAVRLADKYKIYLVNANPERFHFVGKMGRDDFGRYSYSEY